jgi:glycosyltransferase involved in cell wall biosynthesis
MKVLLLTDDRVGPTMAGSALRAWELARVLHRADHTVCVAAAPGSQRPQEEGPPVVSRPPWRWADAVVAPAWCLPPRGFLGRHLLVVDGATPLLAELSVLPDSAEIVNRRITAAARLPLVAARADAVLAAGDPQVAWWQQRLLQHRPEVPVLPVPFGIPDQPPAAERDEIPGVPSNWAVVLWWGGVWPWLDLETLIEARALLGKVPVSIVVPTAPRPGSAAHHFTEDDLLDLAERHGLQPPQVMPLPRWLPYHQRHRILHRTTLLAVLHHPGREAELSFRTRALDGVWAGVPLLVSEGGAVARLTQENQWGGVVPTRNPEAAAAALETLITEQEQLRCRRALAATRAPWRWSRVAEPLITALPKLPVTRRRPLPGPVLSALALLTRIKEPPPP